MKSLLTAEGLAILLALTQARDPTDLAIHQVISSFRFTVANQSNQ